MPFGVGTFPALWMLGQNITEIGGYWASTNGTTGWPACGEIDIIEHWGNNQNFVQSALHTPSSFANTVNKGGQTIANASTEFHIYTLEWHPQLLIFKVDGVTHYIYNPTVKNTATWPFDAPQYLLLNVAIQGDIASNFIQSAMQIDYVRVYQETPLSTPTNEIANLFSIYPNPSNNSVTIETSLSIKEKLIYDLNGKLVKTISDDSKEIYISELSKGIYILKIRAENGATSSQKLIKD
jgi:beta-glucanase (GH16 family)